MFVKLTSANGQEIRINMDMIESYGTITEKSFYNSNAFIGMTYVVPMGMADGAEPYIVKESPSVVQQLCEQTWRWLRAQ